MTRTASAARQMASGRHPRHLVSELKLASLPSTPTWARRHVAEVLKRWNVPDPVRDDAALITSELMTNAVNVTGAESRRLTYGGMSAVPIVRLRLRLMPASLLIEVWDPHEEPPAALEIDPYTSPAGA